MDAALDSNGNGHDTVFTVLAERARFDSRRRLVGYVAVGLVGAVAVVELAPSWWPFAALAMSFAAFGAFGLVPGNRTNVLAGIRLAIAWIGTAAAGAFLVGLFLLWFTGDAVGTYTPHPKPADTLQQLPPSLRQ
jgi:hypothetical protein